MQILLILLICLVGLAEIGQSIDSIFKTVFPRYSQSYFNDPKGEELKDICILKGQDIIKTNDEDYLNLQLKARTGIFAIKPVNYAMPVNSGQIPQYCFLFPSILNRQQYNKSLDFALCKSHEQKKFKVLFFAMDRFVNKRKLITTITM